jgi:uncharacterized damage-inducible protein DinB
MPNLCRCALLLILTISSYGEGETTSAIAGSVMNDNMKDEDIEYGFQMARALGVKGMTTSTTLTMAKRIAPVADKHKLLVGYHGHDQTNDANQTATLESYATLMAYGKYNGVNLDIGHFTAAGYDAVAFIKEHHAKITNLHIKDRKRDHGPNTPWGQGDTPLKEVLQLLKKEKYGFPANIELEYPIPQDSTIIAEIKKCSAYYAGLSGLSTFFSLGSSHRSLSRPFIRNFSPSAIFLWRFGQPQATLGSSDISSLRSYMPRLTIVLTTCLLVVAPLWAQQGKAVEELAKHWKTAKEFTLAVAEAMPDGHYDFKPVSEEMSFAEVLDHIARAQAGSFARIANAKSPVAKPEKMDKAAIIKEITDSFDFCLKALALMPDGQLETLLGPAGKQSTARETMLGAFTHTAHHRGQAEVYLRLQGVKPPAYQF